jgi:epoxyqueuosine reductase
LKHQKSSREANKMERLTKTSLKEFAKSRGLDLVGAANIERFKNAPARMHPSSIFPEAKSVIVVGRRIVRGGWRGIEEGTYWPNYTFFDYHGLLNSFFIPLPLYETCCFLEDAGWEAVPYYPGVPEIQPDRESLRKNTAAYNVHLAIRIAGVAAGLGEMGWSKVFLSKKYGPRQRLAAIITDMPLEPDPLVKPGSICTKCMECVKDCPSGAIPHIKENKIVEIKIDAYTYRWADVDMGKCTLSYHGGDSRVSPFIHKSFPGWNIDAKKQIFSEEAAYKFCWSLSTGNWRQTDEFPDGTIIEGHKYLQKWGDAGSYGIGGSRGCMRSCFNHLETKGDIDQTFHNKSFIKRKRWLLPSEVECHE